MSSACWLWRFTDVAIVAIIAAAAELLCSCSSRFGIQIFTHITPS
jgi:hypothetical protein